MGEKKRDIVENVTPFTSKKLNLKKIFIS